MTRHEGVLNQREVELVESVEFIDLIIISAPNSWS